MTYTEEEAKTKGCPATALPSHPLNRCIGSACMAWRRAQVRNPNWKPDHGMMVTGWQQHPDDKEQMYIADDTRGYCGLAGRP